MNTLEIQADWNRTNGPRRQQQWARRTDDALPSAEGQPEALAGRIPKHRRGSSGVRNGRAGRRRGRRIMKATAGEFIDR